MTARPHLLLFDDPTAGLDPLTAKTVMNEIIKLRDLEHVTPAVVTHQLPDAFYVASHTAVQANGHLTVVPPSAGEAAQADFILLRNGGVHFEGDASEPRASPDPYTRAFLTGWVPPLV